MLQLIIVVLCCVNADGVYPTKLLNAKAKELLTATVPGKEVELLNFFATVGHKASPVTGVVVGKLKSENKTVRGTAATCLYKMRPGKEHYKKAHFVLLTKTMLTDGCPIVRAYCAMAVYHVTGKVERPLGVLIGSFDPKWRGFNYTLLKLIIEFGTDAEGAIGELLKLRDGKFKGNGEFNRLVNVAVKQAETKEEE